MTRKTKYVYKYLNIHKDMSVLSQLIFFWQNIACIMIPDMAYIFFLALYINVHAWHK